MRAEGHLSTNKQKEVIQSSISGIRDLMFVVESD